MTLNKILLVVLTIFSFQILHAQDRESELIKTDSSLVVKKGRKAKKKHDFSNQNPKTATILGIVPGLGQAYNRRYWKIPVIYGLGALFGGYTIYNSQRYDNYSFGLRVVQDTSINQDTFVTMDGDELYESQLEQGRSQYKRQRDFNFFLVLAIYGLQIVDANVDAHLLKFHNSKDFLMGLEPTIINHNNHYSPGIAFSVQLK